MKKRIIAFLMITLIILSAGYVFAQSKDSHENHDHPISVMAYPCDECGSALRYVDETWRDGQAEYGPHGSCTIEGRHTQYWYFDVTGWECTNCSWQELRFGPDYGWYCE